MVSELGRYPFSCDVNLYEQLSSEAKGIVQDCLSIVQGHLFQNDVLKTSLKNRTGTFKNQVVAIEALMQEAIFINSYCDESLEVQQTAMKQIPNQVYIEVSEYLSCKRRISIVEVLQDSPVDHLEYVEGVLIVEVENILGFGDEDSGKAEETDIPAKVKKLIAWKLNPMVKKLSDSQKADSERLNRGIEKDSTGFTEVTEVPDLPDKKSA